MPMIARCNKYENEHQHHLSSIITHHRRSLNLISLQRMLDIMQTALIPIRIHQFLVLSDPLFLLELVTRLLGLKIIEVIGDAES